MGAESGLRRRVKGLSEGEFRQRFGTEGAVPGGAVFAALGQRLGVPGLRPCRLCRTEGPGGRPVQPLQAPGRADRGHRVPLDQAAAHRLVPGDLPPHGLPPGDRDADQARPRRRHQRRDRRPVLLDGGQRSRLRPPWSPARDRTRPRGPFTGSTPRSATSDRAGRDLPSRQRQARPALPDELRRRSYGRETSFEVSMC